MSKFENSIHITFFCLKNCFIYIQYNSHEYEELWFFSIKNIPNLLYDFGQLTLLFGFHLIKTPCNIRLNFFYHTSGREQKEKN